MGGLKPSVCLNQGTASLCGITVKYRPLRSSWASRAVYRAKPLVRGHLSKTGTETLA